MPRGRSRRLSQLEGILREAVAPRTAEDHCDLPPRSVSLADLAFVDGTMSLRRIARRVSSALSRHTSMSDAAEAEVSEKRAARRPPPPPPSIQVTEEVKQAISAAAARRQSVSGASPLPHVR